MATTIVHRAPRRPSRSGSRRAWGITLWLLVLGLVVAAVAAGLLLRGSRVETVAVGLRDLASVVELKGNVEGTGQLELGAVSPGTVASVAVSPGQRVAAGQVLIRLDDRAQIAAVEQARASLEVAEARIAEAQQQVGSDLIAAEDEVARAAQRIDELNTAEADGLLLPASERPQADADLTNANARRDQAAALAADPENAPGIRLATAQRTQAEAALRQAELLLEQRSVIAPVDGTVLERRVEPGDTVGAGEPLVVIARGGPARIVLEPDQPALHELKEGQGAEVVLEGEDEPPVGALVARDGGERVLLAEEVPSSWGAGAPVTARVTTSRREEALAVPVEAVRGARSGTPWVLVAEGRRVERRDVDVGIQGDGFVEIRDGLESGDEVVVGSPNLKPGSRIARR